MSYNEAVISEVLKARSLTEDDLCHRLGMARDEFESKLYENPSPPATFLARLARELSIPPFTFFMSTLPEISTTPPDFRSDNPSRLSKSREAVNAILTAESIQKAAKSSDIQGIFDVRIKKTEFTAENLAEWCRNFLQITNDDQRICKTPNVLYTFIRKKIEDRGVFVIHFSFPQEDGSGFCLSDSNFPTIGINTLGQTRERQIFTLAHEFCHAIIRQTGISDPFRSLNKTEQYCNKFAVNFLLPGDYVRSVVGSKQYEEYPDIERVAYFSRKLNMSQQATALRLEELGIFRSGSYQRWLNLVGRFGNPDLAKKKAAGFNAPQETVKLAKYGFRFADVFERLLEREELNELDIYRISGLKPKYARSYFSYVKSINNKTLNDLNIEDE